MFEIYEKLDSLKNELDNLEVFKKIDMAVRDIKNNEELVNKIKEYNLYKNEKLRLEIYKYEEIIRYKELENEVNMLIMVINKRLKKLNEGGCNNACN